MSTFYSEYMKSRQWQSMRAKRIFKDRGVCKVCGSRHTLEVHHLNYKRLGRERLSDLITLCRLHHRISHVQARVLKK